MKRRLASLVPVVVVAFLVSACTQAAPAPPPTQPPAAPKSAEAAKAPAAAPTTAPAPTAVPAKKLDFPAKNRSITWIIPWPAGGSNDIGARLIAPLMEKEYGVSLELVNKGGASTQIGLTEIAMAKADGYTIGQATLPTNVGAYLDPQRKAAFGRKDLQPVAACSSVPQAISVSVDSPYKTLKDLADAAKAKPKGIRMADPGLLTASQMAGIVFAKTAGVEFAQVHFDGGAPALAAVLGNKVEAQTSSLPVVLGPAKNGQVRILGIEEASRVDLYKDIPTMKEQGYNAVLSSLYGVLMPGGASKEIVDYHSGVVKKALENPELRKKLEDIGQLPYFLGPEQFSKEWDSQEEVTRMVMAMEKS